MLTPALSRGARGILAWTQEQLAKEAKVSVSTVKDFEAERRTPIANNLDAIQRAFEGAGIEFTNGAQPGLRMRARSADDAISPDELNASNDE